MASKDGTGRQPREPMAVRYSAARLETSVEARLVCMASFFDISPGPASSAGVVTGVQLTDRVAAIRTPAWGYGVAAQEAAPHAPRPVSPGAGAPAAKRARPAQGSARHGHVTGRRDDTTDGDSSTSSRTTSSGHSPSEPEDAQTTQVERTLRWILPAGEKTKLHVTNGRTSDDGRLIPLCQRQPFAWGYQEGVGVEEARRTGRLRHAPCWGRVGFAEPEE